MSGHSRGFRLMSGHSVFYWWFYCFESFSLSPSFSRSTFNPPTPKSGRSGVTALSNQLFLFLITHNATRQPMVRWEIGMLVVERKAHLLILIVFGYGQTESVAASREGTKKSLCVVGRVAALVKIIPGSSSSSRSSARCRKIIVYHKCQSLRRKTNVRRSVSALTGSTRSGSIRTGGSD